MIDKHKLYRDMCDAEYMYAHCAWVYVCGSPGQYLRCLMTHFSHTFKSHYIIMAIEPCIWIYIPQTSQTKTNQFCSFCKTILSMSMSLIAVYRLCSCTFFLSFFFASNNQQIRFIDYNRDLYSVRGGTFICEVSNRNKVFFFFFFCCDTIEIVSRLFFSSSSQESNVEGNSIWKTFEYRFSLRYTIRDGTGQ